MSELVSRTDDSVPLAEAAFALGVSYLKARDMLLSGTLKGRRSESRWFVERESIEAQTRRRDA